MNMRSALVAVLAITSCLGIQNAAAVGEMMNPKDLVTVEDKGTHKVWTVTWTDDVVEPYADQYAECNDKVVFKWEGLHDVAILDGGDCAKDALQSIQEPVLAGTAEYTLPKDVDEIYFGCTVGSHCRRGQVIEFYVKCDGGSSNANKSDTAAPAPAPMPTKPGKPLLDNPLVSLTEEDGVNVYTIDWDKNPPSPYMDVDAFCGDKVVFNWTGMHDVAIMTDGDCEQPNSLVTPAVGGMFEYTLPADKDEIYFGCSVGNHCSVGKQLIEFYIQCDEFLTFNSTMVEDSQQLTLSG